MSLAKSRTRRFDSLQQEVYLNLWRTYDRLRGYEDTLFEQHELTAQQYNALRILKAAAPEPVRTLELAARLVSRAPDITRLLDRLEQRGLVARQRRPENRRVVEIAITTAGLSLLGQLAERVRACHQRQLGHLTATELKSLVALLRIARDPHEPKNQRWD